MSSLRYLNAILTVICVVLVLNLYAGWRDSAGHAGSAYAQGIPDEGAQRNAMIDQLKLLNQKVDQLNGLLTSGKARVTVVGDGEGGR